MRNDIRALLRALRDGRVWEALDAPRVSSREVHGIARLIRDENEVAAALLEDILTGPSAWWPQRLRRTHGAMTAGMVSELLRRMPVTLRQKPQDALQLTSMAMMVAEALDPEGYPPGMVPRVRAQALRDHGSVLAFLHRFAEALEYAERAEAAFAHVPCAAHDLARVALCKANALQLRKDRAKEAVALAQGAGETFLLAGDRSRYVTARMIEAALLCENGDLEAAMAVWRSVEAEPDLDAMTRLSITHNMALCLVHLGRQEQAVAPLELCLAEFERLAVLTERTRTRWYLGNALRATPRRREAILALRMAWHEFAELRLTADAALAALDLAEALMLNGQPEQVPMICHEVIAQLTNAGLTEQALPALALLREAEQGKASRELIRETHEKVRRAGREGARVFAAPPGRQE